MHASTTHLRPEPWRWSRPRVLIEHPDEQTGLALAGELRLKGFAVAVCTGPESSERCPLAGPDGCAAAHGADLVVSCLGFDRPERREVLRALRTRCPDVPVVVEIPPSADDEWDDLPDGWSTLASPATPAGVLEAVRFLVETGVVEGEHHA